MRLALAFAFGAGLVSPFNPCGFGLLPAYLSSQLDVDADLPRGSYITRSWRGLVAGASVSAGFAGVLVSAALLVALGLRPVLRLMPYVAVAVGVALVLAGAGILLGRALRLGPLARLSALAPQASRPPSSLVGFGAGYAAASVVCTLAIVLAVIAQALATGTVVGLVAVVTVYGLGAATVLTALTLSTALVGTVMATALRRVLPFVQPLSGALLVLSGLYLVTTNVPGLRDAGPVAAVKRWLSAASADAAASISRLDTWFVPIGVAIVVLAVVLLVLRRRAARRGSVTIAVPHGHDTPDCCARPVNQPATRSSTTSLT